MIYINNGLVSSKILAPNTTRRSLHCQAVFQGSQEVYLHTLPTEVRSFILAPGPGAANAQQFRSNLQLPGLGPSFTDDAEPQARHRHYPPLILCVTRLLSRQHRLSRHLDIPRLWLGMSTRLHIHQRLFHRQLPGSRCPRRLLPAEAQ